MWVDDNNKKYDSLVDVDIKSIQFFSLCNYHFKFGEMSPFDKTSILMKVQSYFNSRTFNPYDFVDYLTLRRIDFSLYFVPVISAGIMENLRNLFVIIELNWRMMKQRAMKGVG